MVPVAEFTDFLERLARGSMSEKPTAVSEVFSQEMMTLMRLEGCITGAKDKECLNMIILRQKVADQEISIELFN